MAGPALAVVRRGEQTVDGALDDAGDGAHGLAFADGHGVVGEGRVIVAGEGVHFEAGGRKADQVVGEAAQQGFAVGGRARHEALLVDLLLHEARGHVELGEQPVGGRQGTDRPGDQALELQGEVHAGRGHHLGEPAQAVAARLRVLLDQPELAEADQVRVSLGGAHAGFTRQVLQSHRTALVGQRLAPLMRAVQVFGFHLAPIDLRQNSEVHARSVAELLAGAGEVDGCGRCGGRHRLPEDLAIGQAQEHRGSSRDHAELARRLLDLERRLIQLHRAGQGLLLLREQDQLENIIAEIRRDYQAEVQLLDWRRELWTAGDQSAGLPSAGDMLDDATRGEINGAAYDSERATRAHLGWW